jgi:hypothetical protein
LHGHWNIAFEIKLAILYLGADAVFLFVMAIKEEIHLTVVIAADGSKYFKWFALAKRGKRCKDKYQTDFKVLHVVNII